MDHEEKFWYSFLMLIVLLVASYISVDKHVHSYYLTNRHEGTMSCVTADVNWGPDIDAFCSSNRIDVLDTFDRLRNTVVR